MVREAKLLSDRSLLAQGAPSSHVIIFDSSELANANKARVLIRRTARADLAECMYKSSIW